MGLFCLSLTLTCAWKDKRVNFALVSYQWRWIPFLQKLSTEINESIFENVSLFISVWTLCARGWAGLLDADFVFMSIKPCFTVPHFQTDIACLWPIDSTYWLNPMKGEVVSLKFRRLPLDSSVDLLCTRSSSTMSHQLTALIERDRRRKKISSWIRQYSSEDFRC